MNLADLRKPFPPAKISWRIGSTNADKSKGMALAYIDARDVQDRLDDVCGLGGWQNRYVPMHDKKTVCEIGVFLENAFTGRPPEWVWKADGAGDSDVEAEKGALSDAFKRAAVKWGIGRYLYDLDSPWVAIEAAGRSFKIAQHEYKRLEALLSSKESVEEPGLARNWVDQQKAIISDAQTLPNLTDWLDKHGGGSWTTPSASSALFKLHRNQGALFKELKEHYLAKMNRV